MTEDEVLEYAGNMADEFREGLADGSTIVSDGPWEETVKAIKERHIIEGLKRNAAKGDVKYSEYVIETLAKAAV